MPPLDTFQYPLGGPLVRPEPRSQHPSPKIERLGLERRSSAERGWWGHRFGLDTPYYAVPLGWGEWAPLYGQDALEGSPDVMVLVVPPQFAPGGGGAS